MKNMRPYDSNSSGLVRQEANSDRSSVAPTLYDFFLPDSPERVLIVEDAGHLNIPSDRFRSTYFSRLKIIDLIKDSTRSCLPLDDSNNFDASIVDLRSQIMNDYFQPVLSFDYATRALRNLRDLMPVGAPVIGLGLNRYGKIINYLRRPADYDEHTERLSLRAGLGGTHSYRRIFRQAGFSAIQIYLVLPDFESPNKVITANWLNTRAHFRKEHSKNKRRDLSWLLSRLFSEFGINLIVEPNIVITARR